MNGSKVPAAQHGPVYLGMRQKLAAEDGCFCFISPAPPPEPKAAYIRCMRIDHISGGVPRRVNAFANRITHYGPFDTVIMRLYCAVKFNSYPKPIDPISKFFSSRRTHALRGLVTSLPIYSPPTRVQKWGPIEIGIGSGDE
jgi:hypothetical protein